MGKNLREKLQKDTLVLDGAFGTYIQSAGLDNSHFGEHPGCMEYLSVSSPELISKVHADYFEAGSDAVETNTFGGNSLKLSEYGLAEKAYEINLTSTLLARKEADRFSTPENPRYVIGTMGPTGKLPSSGDPSIGDITYGELKDIFFRQAGAIIDGGADAILVETGQDLLEMKAAVNGARKAAAEKNKDIVLMSQCTLANNGRMLLGTEVSAFMAVMGYLGVDIIGLNCSTGPVEMEPAIKFLSENASCFISCVPNAGLPVDEDGRTVYPLSPEEMASIVSSFVSKYRIDVIGGCCGTTPRHISEIKKALSGHEKRGVRRKSYVASSYRAFDIGSITRPIKVGERMNTQGSRKMKDLLTAVDYDSIVELGKLQEKQGALVLDLCTVLTERTTEKKDTAELTRRVAESVEVPLMIDSTDEDVIAGALESYPGTAFVNSANLEDGGGKARGIFDLASEHGALVVCLVIDENGMARTTERKLEVAGRLYNLAVDECGIEPSRLIFDMLTFTLGTGEKEYATSALDTLEAIKAFKKEYPDALTVLGVSNVSFGLKKSSRKVLNSVFLEKAVEAGLDMAIVNPAEYQENAVISGKEKSLAEDLIFNVSDRALEAFVEYFANVSSDSRSPAAAGSESRLSIEEKLAKCVLERDKTNILPLIDEARNKYPPEVIINEILMETMREVGDKLDSGEIVLPYVLQSAEVMKKAIEYLESFLPREAVSKRGKVLLATVAGDVHDIGKNLVKMILKNNGFSVIDLGKQVPVETIIEQAEKNKVDAVGLSALLVSTSRHMKTCVQLMHKAGLDYPVLVGGAPVNERFTRSISLMDDNSFYKGGVFYARDAFTGLKIMQALVNKAGKEKALKEYADSCARAEEIPAGELPASRAASKNDKSFDAQLPIAPFRGPRTITNIPVDEVFKYLDKRMLFDLSWGSGKRGGPERAALIEDEYEPKLIELKEESIRKGWLDLKAVYGYFDCRVKDGRRMEILGTDGKRVEVIDLTAAPGGVSIADNFAPGGDIVAFQAVTIGGRITGAIEELGGKDEASKAFYLHGIGVNLAEALAAYVHDRIRSELGLGKDQGRRYSPGYPIWKDLEDQKKIFRLLDIERRIGVRLTEDCQMVPEQSTTAMIVHRNGSNR